MRINNKKIITGKRLIFYQIFSSLEKLYVDVVVQFYPSLFKFYFPLFLSLLMYDDQFQTKEYKI